MEFNKIFAAILVAGIIASLSGFISKKLVHPHELEENAVKIEGADEDVAGGPKKEKLPEPILALIADADVARGEKISKACAACHSFDKGGANGVGPNMYGIVGRAKQSVAGFSYSGTLNERGGDVWTYAELNKYLWKPKWYAPKTKMNYLGLKKPEDRAALIAWMNTMSDSPKGPPSAADIGAEFAELAPISEESAEDIKEAVEVLENLEEAAE
ncbi:MAG: cytochrome c family protein [Pseudomonadota bacterium]